MWRLSRSFYIMKTDISADSVNDLPSFHMQEAIEARANGDRSAMATALRTLATTSNPSAAIKRFLQLLSGSTYAFNTLQGPSTLPLTIIMPVYNIGPYVEASICSVLGQTFRDFELLIVDDASTDTSGLIAALQASRDSRTRVITLPINTLGGAGIPSNIALDQARGEYIGFVDGDDYAAPDAFGSLMQVAQQHKPDLVIGDFCRFTDKSSSYARAYDKHWWKHFPVGRPFTAAQHPYVFRLSPVPWRKLYRRSLLQNTQIRFAEGDYFYEDNPLHWKALLHAESIVASDTVVSYHRMAREGQTMSSSATSFFAVFMHIMNVALAIPKTAEPLRKSAWLELLDQIYRSDWIFALVEKMPAPDRAKLKDLLCSRYHTTTQFITERAGITIKQADQYRQGFADRFSQYRPSTTRPLLSIVIPLHNSPAFLTKTLPTLVEQAGRDVQFIMVNDGSTDETSTVLARHCSSHPNCFALEKPHRGAGRARNAAIPICDGEFTFFLDADDAVNLPDLLRLTRQAQAGDSDLVVFKYTLTTDPLHRQHKGGMNQHDINLWKLIENNLPDQHTILQSLCQLGNYPWIRVLRTSTMQSKGIFFGHTLVHNDIQFHWHSLIAADSVTTIDASPYSHFLSSESGQLTNINDGRRLAIFDALASTWSVISKSERAPAVSGAWKSFCSNILTWAESMVGVEHRGTFAARKHAFSPFAPLV
jgi:glycosyltransferase involved in cell wall biosynthesis